LIESLITSKTRIKLLLKFFLNPKNTGYLRSLESEFGESTNSIRLELNRLEAANMLHSKIEGNKKLFHVNQSHPLFNEINSIVKKYVGINVIIESIIQQLGEVKSVVLIGDLALGKETDIIDLIIEGKVDQVFLNVLIVKAEKLIKRRIRYLIMNEKEFKIFAEQNGDGALVIWSIGR
jgi:hypothetical protein